MLTARLVQMIESHADALARDVMTDLERNPRTPAFRRVPHDELEARVIATYRNLGTWMQSSGEDAVRAEYEQWGRKRFREGILFSEIVYVFVVLKRHLRAFISDHALVEFSGDPGPSGLIGVQLHGVQELNYMVVDFFDRALYHLARGYEAEALASETVAPAR